MTNAHCFVRWSIEIRMSRRDRISIFTDHKIQSSQCFVPEYTEWGDLLRALQSIARSVTRSAIYLSPLSNNYWPSPPLRTKAFHITVSNIVRTYLHAERVTYYTFQSKFNNFLYPYLTGFYQLLLLDAYKTIGNINAFYIGE